MLTCRKCYKSTMTLIESKPLKYKIIKRVYKCSNCGARLLYTVTCDETMEENHGIER